MESSELFPLIFDSLSEGVCTFDRGWRITTFNRAMEEITGLNRHEAIGRSLEELFHAEDCRCRPVLISVVETGLAQRDVPVTITGRGGGRIPINLNATPILDRELGIVGVVATIRDVSTIEILRRELSHDYTSNDIVSKDPLIQRIMDILPDVAESDSSVLISGPSGTGKELIARAVHNLSHRKGERFVAVNCGALPDTLLESELFGYRKGAFTDARTDKPGRFALAEGGTLFLDEIGDLSLPMQVKLLRVLQEKEYEPLGSTATVKTNVRILAATNRDLATMVLAETFRNDLYYRLNVVELKLPSLAERRGDIPLLINHFLQRFNAEKGRSVRGISQAAMNRLMRYSFPGNIRELENIIEYAYILCRCDEIQEQCLPQNLLLQTGDTCFTPLGQPLGKTRGQDEKARILEVLEKQEGHRGRSAQILGVNPSTLWRKMKRYGIS